MSDTDRIARALQAADAAGDTATARALALQLRQMQSAPELSAGEEPPGYLGRSRPFSAPRIDPEREAGFGPRALASLPLTTAGKVAAFERVYGKGNVVTATDGAIFIRDPAKGEFYPADSEDLTAADVADFGGEALQGALAAGLTATGLGAGMAAGAGSGVRQLAGELVAGGEDEMSTDQRAGRVALDTVLGAGAQHLANAASWVWNALRPSTIARTSIAATANRARHAPEIAKSEALERELGVTFTPGQKTQSRGLLTTEGMLRRHPVSADLVAANDQKQLGQMLSALEQRLEAIRPGQAMTEHVGARVQTLFRDTVQKAAQLRRQQAKVDFALVDSAAGTQRVIGPHQTVATLDELIRQFDVAGGGDATAGLVGRLKQVRSEFTTPGPKGTRIVKPRSGAELNRLLQIYGDAATGKGKIFQDLDRGQQRMIAARVFGALQKDLDEAAGSGELGADVAAALKAARDNYRANSQGIDALRKSTLGKVVGEDAASAPERIVERIEQLKPSQAGALFRTVAAIDPDAAQIVKRGVIQRIAERAQPTAKAVERQFQTGAPVEAISPGRFLAEMRKSPIWDSLSPDERYGMAQIAGGMQRLANRAGTDGSPTAPLTFAKDLAVALVGTLSHLDVIGATRLAASIMAPRRLAETMTDPAGLKAWGAMLQELARPRGANLRRLEAATMTLAGVAATAPAATDARPDPELDAALGAERPPPPRSRPASIGARAAEMRGPVPQAAGETSTAAPFDPAAQDVRDWYARGGVAGMMGMRPAAEGISERNALARDALSEGDVRAAIMAQLENPMTGAFGPADLGAFAGAFGAMVHAVSEAKGLSEGLFETWVKSAKDPSKVAPVEVAKNPSTGFLARLLHRSQEQTLRYFRDESGNLYVWDAAQAIHTQIAPAFGVTPKSEGLIVPPKEH